MYKTFIVHFLIPCYPYSLFLFKVISGETGIWMEYFDDRKVPSLVEESSLEWSKSMHRQDLTNYPYIIVRVGPNSRFGRIPGNFEYQAGYQILKLSGYRIYGKFFI